MEGCNAATDNGFTLLEVVLAMALFAGCLLGLTAMTAGVMRCNQTTRERTVALQLAKNQMERFGQCAYADIRSAVAHALAEDGSEGTGRFTRQVVVRETTAPDLKQVTVMVSWRSRGRHQVAIGALFAP